MAAGLWSRGPNMWSWIQKKRLSVPDPSPQDFADLYAYFYSSRFFDRPGDAARGRATFYGKGCGDCHRQEPPAAPGPASMHQWPPLPDPVALIERMWNAAEAMKEAAARRKIVWPELNSQESADLHAFLEGLPDRRVRTAEILPPSTQSGQRLFLSKGCSRCHSGDRSLSGRFSGRTLTDFAAAMWNRAPAMEQRPRQLSSGEMRNIAGYLWALQIVEPPGSAQRGKQVFAKGGCDACHGSALSGAPRLTAHWVRPFILMATLWRHGPAMHRKMQERRKSWPRFTKAELADLAAYLTRAGPRGGF